MSEDKYSEIRSHAERLVAARESFIQESDAWCNSLGYSLFQSNGDGTMRNYICNDGTRSASIINSYIHGDISTEVCAVGNWQWIQITSGRQPFKTHRVNDLIEVVHDLVLASDESRQRIHHRNVLEKFKRES